MTKTRPAPPRRGVHIAGLTLLTLLASACGNAAEPNAARGALHAEHPWVRATPPNAPVAGGYFTLRNESTVDDRLLSISSPDAQRVEIHEMREAGGAMQMRALPDGVAAAAGTSVELKPGGIHLMFIAPTHPYAAGGTVRATLTFAHAPAQTLVFPVQPLGAMHPPAGVDGAQVD